MQLFTCWVGWAGQGLNFDGPKTGRAYKTLTENGPGRAQKVTGWAGQGRAVIFRPVQGSRGHRPSRAGSSCRRYQHFSEWADWIPAGLSNATVVATVSSAPGLPVTHLVNHLLRFHPDPSPSEYRRMYQLVVTAAASQRAIARRFHSAKERMAGMSPPEAGAAAACLRAEATDVANWDLPNVYLDEVHD